MGMVAGNNRVPRSPARMMPLNFGFVISRPAPSFLDHAQKPIPPQQNEERTRSHRTNLAGCDRQQSDRRGRSNIGGDSEKSNKISSFTRSDGQSLLGRRSEKRLSPVAFGFNEW